MDHWEQKRQEAIDQVAMLVKTYRNLKVITVVGSAKENHGNGDEAMQVGKLVGNLKFHLVTGGRGGVMQDVTVGFVNSNRDGIAIGVIPQGGTPIAPSDEKIFTRVARKIRQ